MDVDGNSPPKRSIEEDSEDDEDTAQKRARVDELQHSGSLGRIVTGRIKPAHNESEQADDGNGDGPEYDENGYASDDFSFADLDVCEDSDDKVDGYITPVRSRTGSPAIAWPLSRAPGYEPEYSSWFVHTLKERNIRIRSKRDPLPGRIKTLVDRILQSDRSSPEPSEDDIYERNNHVETVEDLFQGPVNQPLRHIFEKKFVPDNCSNFTDIAHGVGPVRIRRHIAPGCWETGREGHVHGSPLDERDQYGHSQTHLYVPRPHNVYAYDAEYAFRDLRGGNGHYLHYTGHGIGKNHGRTVFPFLAMAFVGDHRIMELDRMWKARNKLLHASSACVNINEILNDKAEGRVSVDHTVFSIAMGGNEVRLYVSWLQYDGDTETMTDDDRGKQVYYMADVECYLLRRTEDYLNFRRVVRNIMTWATTGRLEEYKHALRVVSEGPPRRSEDLRRREDEDEEGEEEVAEETDDDE